MNTTSLLIDLQRLDVDVTAKGDKLVVNAPRGVLTPKMLSSIAEQKEALLGLLSVRPGCPNVDEMEEKEARWPFRPGEPPEPFDILSSSSRGRDSPPSRTWVPASLATGLPGFHSGLLLHSPSQALVPASPAVHAESLTPRLTSTIVPLILINVKCFGLGSGFPSPAPNKDSPLIPPSEQGGSSRLDG